MKIPQYSFLGVIMVSPFFTKITSEHAQKLLEFKSPFNL